METVQVNITRPSVRAFTPVQHNTTISGSYNTTTRNNQDSHNRTSNNGRRRRQGAEVEPWEKDERSVRRPGPFLSSKSDGDQWEHSKRAEHEAVGTSSSAPPAFPQSHSTQYLSPFYSCSVELDNTQPTDEPSSLCPTCRRPWPSQIGTRDVTGCFDDLQDSNRLQPPHDHHEYDINAPPLRFDNVPSVHHSRLGEAQSGRTPSDWTSDYPSGDRLGPQDQHQPLLLNRQNHDDTPATSRHRVADTFYPGGKTPVFREPNPSRQSYTPRLSSERLVETRAHPNDERSEGGQRSPRFPEDNGRGFVRYPPRKYERNIAVDYDIRVASAGARSEDRVYTNERLIDDSDSGFELEFRKQVVSSQYPRDTQPAQDVVTNNLPTTRIKSNNPFRNRTHVTTTRSASSAFGRNPFVF